MTIILSALALAATPAPAVVQPAAPASHAMHAQHADPAKLSAKTGAKTGGDSCPCCKDMAAGGMACCAKHGEGHGGEQGGGHEGHKATN